MIEDYCQYKAAPQGSNLYYSILFCPKPLQRSLYALHGFNAEIEHVIEECSDPGVARIKLQWWHEEIQRVYANQARHPVGKALIKLIAQHPIAEEQLHQIIQHVEHKLDSHTPDSYAALFDSLRSGPGLFWQLNAEICNYHDQRTPIAATELGCLIALFQILQNTYKDAVQGRLFLPQEELDRTNIKLADLATPNNKMTHSFFATQFEQLMQQLNNNYSAFPNQDRRSQLCCLIMNRLITHTCKEIARDNYNLQQYKITLTPLRKLWIAWRTKVTEGK